MTSSSPSAASSARRTPEDPYLEWPGEDGTFLVPMFLLYDYSFHPPDVPPERAVPWARDSGVLCTDERMLDPSPWPSARGVVSRALRP
jgi:hypothetical protein